MVSAHRKNGQRGTGPNSRRNPKIVHVQELLIRGLSHTVVGPSSRRSTRWKTTSWPRGKNSSTLSSKVHASIYVLRERGRI